MASIILDSNTNKIQGDFDSATASNRTTFQTSTLNANTGVYALPNGTGTIAGWGAAGNSDLTNASVIQMLANGTTDTQIVSGKNGTGTYLPLGVYTNNTQRLSVTTTGALVLGTGTSNYGTSGQVLTSSGNGVPTWSTPAGGMTLLGTIATTSGTSVSLSSLVLTSYKQLQLVTNAVQNSATAAGFILINSSRLNTSATTSSATALYGNTIIDLTSGAYNGAVGTLAGSTTPYLGASGLTTASTSITITASGTGAAFAGGSILVYGVA